MSTPPVRRDAAEYTSGAGRRRQRGIVLAGCILGLAGCNGERPPAEAEVPVVLGPENVIIVEVRPIVIGPYIAGELSPAQAATLRAEIQGQVEATYVEVGESVAPGELLARIDDRALRDERRAAAAAVAAAAAAVETGASNVRRAELLLGAGGIALQELETARLDLATAESQLADARARVATAEEQLGNTVIRAPIEGEVRARDVSAGDVVLPGADLFTILDPSSMRLEATVPAEGLGALRVGAPVDFRVQGYPGRSFRGRIVRINPAADSLTREVQVLVTIPNAGRELVAGLYAEGRVESETRRGLVLPMVAVDMTGLTPNVLRVQHGRAQWVEVGVGVRDERTETVEILRGLAPGDTVLVGVARTLTPGTPVRVQAAPLPAER